MGIQYLLSMSKGHPMNTLGDVIEGCPQCFNDFTIHLFHSRNVAGWIPWQAWILVAMDVKQANTSSEPQRFVQNQFWTLVHSLWKVDSILAHNIIHNQRDRNVHHVIGECFAKTMSMLICLNVNTLHIHHWVDECIWTHLSPFWKSTTEAGTKKPWQQAVAPMPVTSRWCLLEFVCSIALYVLHVLGYSHWQYLRSLHMKMGCLTYLDGFFSTPEMGLIWHWICHEGHACGKWNILLSSPALHMLYWEVTIHDEGSDEFIPLNKFMISYE